MASRISALVLAAGVTLATVSAFAQSSATATAPIVVTPSQQAQDDLIKSEVIDRIAADSRLEGQVGVEIDQRNVTLTGLVLDPNQVEWAEQDALAVDGVRDVTNLVNARIGAF